MPDNTVTIDKDELNELRSDQLLLDALFAAGVKDWEGYEIAKDMIDD